MSIPIKLTKNELRTQQIRLTQFRRYLPTLQLKKAMLQFEVMSAQQEISHLKKELDLRSKQLQTFSSFLLEKVSCNLTEYADILHVEKRYENIAGVEIPILERVVFREVEYSLFDTPVWTDRATEILREFMTMRERFSISKEKCCALEKELQDVSIRVNLFEKILIPRAQSNISKIRIFLGDQQLAAVAQAKVAKRKIAQRRTKYDR